MQKKEQEQQEQARFPVRVWSRPARPDSRDLPREPAHVLLPGSRVHGRLFPEPVRHRRHLDAGVQRDGGVERQEVGSCRVCRSGRHRNAFFVFACMERKNRCTNGGRPRRAAQAAKQAGKSRVAAHKRAQADSGGGGGGRGRISVCVCDAYAQRDLLCDIYTKKRVLTYTHPEVHQKSDTCVTYDELKHACLSVGDILLLSNFVRRPPSCQRTRIRVLKKRELYEFAASVLRRTLFLLCLPSRFDRFSPPLLPARFRSTERERVCQRS